MRICLLNSQGDSAPYQSILEAAGHSVVAANVADDQALHLTKQDVFIWNFSEEKQLLSDELQGFSYWCQGHSSPTIAILPAADEQLEKAAHAYGIEQVLCQPTSAGDLQSALARSKFEYPAEELLLASIPLVLVVGDDACLVEFVRESVSTSSVVCVFCQDQAQAQRRCRQLTFDCVVVCETAGSLAYHQVYGQVRPSCEGADFLGFLARAQGTAVGEEAIGVTWIDPTKGKNYFARALSGILEDRNRLAKRRELDSEIISKQQELQRVNAMLRTINKAFRDTNLRLEREGHTKDQMLGVAAHELKSPLAAMAGALDVLQEDYGKYDPEDRQLIDLIQRNNRRMIKLVENVLDLSRVEARRVTMMLATCTARSLVEQALDTVSMGAKRKGIRFDLICPDDDPSCHVDLELVQQMLVNLLDNAVKFSPTDSVVRVIIRPLGREMHFVVSDEGPGIPADERALVFERFHRRSRGSDLHSAGSGLGLTITQALAKLHQGRISVGESPSGGALMTLSLPHGVDE